jgi:hypothetical protein
MIMFVAWSSKTSTCFFPFQSICDEGVPCPAETTRPAHLLVEFE